MFIRRTKNSTGEYVGKWEVTEEFDLLSVSYDCENYAEMCIVVEEMNSLEQKIIRLEGLDEFHILRKLHI